MRVVAALGGNALLRRGEPLDAATQRRNVGIATAALAAVAREHELIVTHGNGPQVGLLALQAEAYAEGGAYPLDVLGAESEGMIGYMLSRACATRCPTRDVATLLTQVVVDAVDPAFDSPDETDRPRVRAPPKRPPSRPPRLDRAPRRRALAPCRRLARADRDRRDRNDPAARRRGRARRVRRRRRSAGRHRARRKLERRRGRRRQGSGGRAAGDRARRRRAAAAHRRPRRQIGWGTPDARALRNASPAQLRRLGLAAGSMGPKVEAASRFAEATGGSAVSARSRTQPRCSRARPAPASRRAKRHRRRLTRSARLRGTQRRKIRADVAAAILCGGHQRKSCEASDADGACGRRSGTAVRHRSAACPGASACRGAPRRRRRRP